MKISKSTLSIIRNFANINNSIVLSESNRLATVSESKTIMGEVSIPETFPVTFRIYDLGEFLSIVNLFNEPEFNFNDTFVTISDVDSSSKIKYYAAGESVVKDPPKNINFPAPEISFVIEASKLAMIVKSASVLKASDISVIGTTGEMIKVIAADKKNVTSNAFELTLEVVSPSDFKANLKIDNLKLIPGTYTVDISSKRISRFTNVQDALTYFIAVESDSEF